MDWILDSARLLAKGGYVMVPLLICSVVSVTVLIERYIKVRQAHVDVSEAIHRAQEAIYSGNHNKALVLLEAEEVPVTRVLAAGLRNRHLGERVCRKGDGGARHQRGVLSYAPSRHARYHHHNRAAAGTLGTVTGMISAFHVMAAKEGIRYAHRHHRRCRRGAGRHGHRSCNRHFYSHRPQSPTGQDQAYRSPIWKPTARQWSTCSVRLGRNQHEVKSLSA